MMNNGVQNQQALPLRFNLQSQLQYRINRNQQILEIRLRGSWIAQQHQELLIQVQNGVNGDFARISRNNAEDTFQMPAVEQYGNNNMPNLRVVDYRALNVPLSRIYETLLEVRAEMAVYLHGDCQDFAQAIMDRTHPNYVAPVQNDDFM